LTSADFFFSFSLLPAISFEDGVLHCDIIEGSFRTESFSQFLNQLLDHMQPYPASNSVVVMDNCAIHKNPSLRQMVEER
jgi:hypothetical protein